MGAPCFRAGFCSKTIIPDSEEHPLASSRAVPKAVLRWIRVKGGLTLFLGDVAGPGELRRLVEGGPLFVGWSPDSRYLIAHSGRAHYLVDTGSDGEALRMPGVASLYMASSWSPRANRMVFLCDSGGDRQRLLTADTVGGDVREVTEMAGNAAFAWSPDGNAIALVRDLDAQTGYYGGIWLLGAQGGEERRITDDPVLSMFWSPDGARMAYVTPSGGGEGSIRWGVLDVANEVTRYLADFRPTQEQLTAFMHFDQYAQSHMPWSPDSRQLVFSGLLGQQPEPARLPADGPPGVFVVGVEGDDPPTQVAPCLR